jgi:hypothetical protein
VKKYVAAMQALRKKEREEKNLSLPPKLVEKLVWVPIISFPLPIIESRKLT